MNSRSIEILRILSLESKTILELADIFDLTDRTIRNDLSSINDFLSSKGIEKIKSDHLGKLSVDLEPGQISTLLDRSDFYNFKLTKEERGKLISYVLILTRVPIRIQQLAEAFYVSRSTLNNDLDQIRRRLLMDDNLELELLPFSNKGIHIEGPEEDKRRVLMTLLNDTESNLTIDQYDFIESFFLEDEEQFSSYERQILEKIIAEQLHLFSVAISDTSLAKLKTYLEVMIKRNRAGAFINSKARSKKSLLADEIYKLIRLYYNLPENKGEERALQDFLSTLGLREDNVINKNSVDIQLYTREFIKNISEALKIDLNGDYEFYESLSTHLSSIQRDDGKFSESNPFVEKIVRENEAISKVVLDNIKGFETLFERKLNDVDISYIVVHICAALERKTSRQNEIDVVLICNAGIGTSRLLQQRIKKHFNLPHLKIQTPQDPIEGDRDTLVISTIDLKTPGLNYIKVKPVLTDEDYIKIGQRIEEINQKINEESRRRFTDEDSINELIREINSAILYERGDLYKMIEFIDEKILDYLGIYQANNPRLYKILTPDFIVLDAEVDTWQEAIRLAGNLLVKKGVIDPSYIDSCIEMIENYGAYMFIGEEVLLPHSYVEEGNRNVGFTFVRLKNPIELSEGRSIRYICMMSAVDEKKHLRALFTLGNLVQNPEYLKQLSEATTGEEIYEIIRDYDFVHYPISIY